MLCRHESSKKNLFAEFFKRLAPGGAAGGCSLG
ncbi:hypothetical protein MSL71_7700 [Desulfoluna butyratoxydans]|uniref:Uncharacterized protein n=1 Tax=Desulfoluna butyratoxydans TaxID=231438 RepID=A0A4U8YNB2_9BACT|nr:hypothetical protein MSL71_7700 [Desulfoluna butyratoxydans]